MILQRTERSHTTLEEELFITRLRRGAAWMTRGDDLLG